jgi:hypothetical protein
MKSYFPLDEYAQREKDSPTRELSLSRENLKGTFMAIKLRYFAVVSVFLVLQTMTFAENPVECYPACRAGFVCHNGKCISKCNPPCPEGQKCTDTGDCAPMSQSESIAIQPNDIKCVKVFIVRPQMDSATISGTFAEREYLSASNLVAGAIGQKISTTSTVITVKDIDAIQKCDAKMIVAKVKSYYKEPSTMGQYCGVMTLTISTYLSPQNKLPAKTQELSAKGNRHWGDSAPLENAIEAICKEIRRNYKP